MDTLHSIAFDKQVGEQLERTGKRNHYYLDTVGDRRAKRAFTELLAQAHKATAGLSDACDKAATLLLDGASPEDKIRMRGTELGKGLNSADEELAEALQAQQRRRARGEFSPTSIEPQPFIRKR